MSLYKSNRLVEFFDAFFVFPCSAVVPFINKECEIKCGLMLNVDNLEHCNIDLSTFFLRNFIKKVIVDRFFREKSRKKDERWLQNRTF